MKRYIDRDTAVGIKRSLKQALDTEAEQRDAEHNEMAQRLISHFDRFIEGRAGDGPSD